MIKPYKIHHNLVISCHFPKLPIQTHGVWQLQEYQNSPSSIPRGPNGSKWRSLDPGISRWCHWDVSSSEHLKAYQPLPGWGGWKLHSLKLTVHSKSPWKLGLFAPKGFFFHLPSSLIFRGELAVSFGEGSRCWLGHDLGWIWKHNTNGQRSPGLILPECIFFSVWEKYGTWTVMISDRDLGILTPFSASMLIFKGVYQFNSICVSSSWRSSVPQKGHLKNQQPVEKLFHGISQTLATRQAVCFKKIVTCWALCS